MDRQHTLPVRDQRLNRENYKLFKKLGEGHFGKVRKSLVDLTLY
ncbi:hypothetical protein CRE_14824 [Caenorhabditis remanei]|uniref:Protein kinase domain-containing protein n=1 Tax=Caenorhabditis remanei TaxID=31234 RepID=E3MRW4_CAERE|nr:hypothetical protein CRE_14824 [Caenorhabditis remanei]